MTNGSKFVNVKILDCNLLIEKFFPNQQRKRSTVAKQAFLLFGRVLPTPPYPVSLSVRLSARPTSLRPHPPSGPRRPSSSTSEPCNNVILIIQMNNPAAVAAWLDELHT